MNLSQHVAVSTIVSGILYILFKSWSMTIAALLSGIFIDLDYYIDYLIEYGSPFDFKKFFYTINEEHIKKLYMIFHGWEWSVVLLAIGWLSGWNHWVIGTLIGYGHHMITDAIFNTNWTLSGYSLLWRWKNDFISESIRPRRSELHR